jgi:hypothetical protein
MNRRKHPALFAYDIWHAGLAKTEQENWKENIECKIRELLAGRLKHCS